MTANREQSTLLKLNSYKAPLSDDDYFIYIREACDIGSVKVLIKIRELGAKLEHIMQNTEILSSVAKLGRVEIFTCLFQEFGLTDEDARANNNQVLRSAAEYGHIEVVKYLREEFGLTVEDARACGNDSLQVASMNGHIEVVKYLREGFGLTVEDARACDNEALQNASVGGHIAVMKYLHESFGLTIEDARDNDNEALRSAAGSGYIEVVKYLREEFGLTLEDARDNDNEALRSAAEYGYIEVVKYLHEGFGLTAEDAALIPERYRYIFSTILPIPILVDEEERDRSRICFAYQMGLEDPRIPADCGDDLETVCAICRGGLLYIRNRGDGIQTTVQGAELLILDCGHIFHSTCVQDILNSSSKHYCPLDRCDIVDEDMVRFDVVGGSLLEDASEVHRIAARIRCSK